MLLELSNINNPLLQSELVTSRKDYPQKDLAYITYKFSATCELADFSHLWKLSIQFKFFYYPFYPDATHAKKKKKKHKKPTLAPGNKAVRMCKNHYGFG